MYGRVILLNPLHKSLPRLVICLMPTCNSFDHHVFMQWQIISRNFEKWLEDLVGPLVGNSSDGDSRRRMLMVQLMLVDVTDDKGDSFTIRSIGDQDPNHNHKKIINHLDHVSRVIYIGPYLIVLMNHVEMSINRLPVFEHRLAREQRQTKLENCSINYLYKCPKVFKKNNYWIR